MNMKHLHRLHRKIARTRQSKTAILVIVMVAIIGTIVLITSHAATPYVSIEAEDGTLSTNVGSNSSSSASGGSYVAFGQTSIVPTGTAGLGTPLACPSGAVAVNKDSATWNFAANTNYCFAAGTYSGFSKQIPTGDGWFGQGQAVLDGGFGTSQAIYNGGTASNVTIDGFTVQHYDYTGCSNAECVMPTSGYSINIQYGTNITVTDNTFQDGYNGGYSAGGGVGLGANGPVCAYPANITSLALAANCYNYITDSTISHNVFNGMVWGGPAFGDAYDVSANYNIVEGSDPGAVFDTEGYLAAFGKFSLTADATVKGNYLANNIENGIWFDVFNVDSYIENNTIVGTPTAQSAQSGIFDEISCNAVITGNNISNVGYSDANSGNWGAGVRISSSGSSTASGSGPINSACGHVNTSGAMPGYQGEEIENNTFTNDLDDIALYDGHCDTNPCNSDSIVTDNNILISGNTFNATTEAGYLQKGDGHTYTGPNESDAVVIEAANPELNVSSNNNTFHLYRTTSFGNGGDLTFAQWKADGFDTTGSTCSLIGGGSC
jgi:hypothetical protein